MVKKLQYENYTGYNYNCPKNFQMATLEITAQQIIWHWRYENDLLNAQVHMKCSLDNLTVQLCNNSKKTLLK